MFYMFAMTSLLSTVCAENNILPTEVRTEALKLQLLLEFEDNGADGPHN